ncbi:LysR family transcriptional regulator [Nocardioides sp. TRM66260-LWL]|uniref:LysR family transcriptional regulator n=1 Tax=Nocardioides sp. TRM66260-LWL TaxID=2874478 RepID=UPI001CC77266|nr:LysR family transcriptional regulator [Nocardioides sp. TRM66260-LWL]MBZ5734421.1 LysR family transcriptional regulator [Nocardioides sp. TRM66260-LWL]
MRIEQLEYLLAVTEHGSLRRASERLHLSQPALSEALTKLERELGVTLLDRHRSGSRISREGRALHRHMVEVLDAVGRLRAAAGDDSRHRPVRLGTVNAATSTLLVPAVAAFQREHPELTVEVQTIQQRAIHEGLADGTLDLGLVNELLDDDPDSALGLTGTVLLRGRPVAVLPAGHRLASHPEVSVDDLREERFVGMRAGYLMHRVAEHLFEGTPPRTVHSTDGAEMGKVMVAEGLGVTLLPDYSVEGDPMHRAGLIVHRPIAGEAPGVRLVLRHRRLDGGQRPPAHVVELVGHLRRTAAAL